MPKINVYLPDDLAESVKETGLPVSAICQRALEQSVKRVSTIRATVFGELPGEDPTAGLTSFTQRAKDVLKLSIASAKDRGTAEIGTRDLLAAILTEGANLAVHILVSMDVGPETVRRELDALQTLPSNGSARMGSTAANALELAVIEALALGHNYVGCEHLLLGLIAEPDGSAGQVLRTLGVEQRSLRQTVSAALMGYVQANQAASGGVVANLVATSVGKALEPVLRRLDRLEEQASRPL
jgi:ATP-dependent Clp protease ATP-binding subunit ClpC